ncbi:MAG: tRNA (adenosine(37)-N6)-threonylcarbamoyltransferase complex transferase subunit TsaD [Caldisericia bacterium]|nr:tRNA (adenosine(37)-N6)-threonylcarbamoyltransferase complex transferase subunit TsaD [Caldisericia bacterium]
MNILGIETSCDDTAVAVVNSDGEILSNVLSSQTEFHAKYGGIVPEIASRKHLELISHVCFESLEKAQIKWSDIDLISVTKGPGLVGSLLVGVEYARGLSVVLKKPIKGINHMEGHLLSPLLTQKVPFPYMGLVISGGHTEFVLVEKSGKYLKVSSTVDDACGESLDKFGKQIGILYPAGPLIEKLAIEGNSKAYQFPLPKVKKDPLAMSFSGLKTSVMHVITSLSSEDLLKEKQNLCASYQYALFRHVLVTAKKVVLKYPVRALTISGGVSANMNLYKTLSDGLSVPVFKPAKKLSTDNAAMIAYAGFLRFKAEGPDSLNFEVFSNLPLASYNTV